MSAVKYVLNEFGLIKGCPLRVVGSSKVAQLHQVNFRTWSPSLKTVVITVADSFTAHVGSSRLLVVSMGNLNLCCFWQILCKIRHIWMLTLFFRYYAPRKSLTTLNVVAGQVNLINPDINEQITEVYTITIFPEYNSTYKLNDVALIRVNILGEIASHSLFTNIIISSH